MASKKCFFIGENEKRREIASGTSSNNSKCFSSLMTFMTNKLKGGKKKINLISLEFFFLVQMMLIAKERLKGAEPLEENSKPNFSYEL